MTAVTVDRVNKTHCETRTDFFEVKWKDTAFEKILKKVRSKRDKRREDFLVETIGNAMRKRKGVEVTGMDWENSIDDIMKGIIAEV